MSRAATERARAVTGRSSGVETQAGLVVTPLGLLSRSIVEGPGKKGMLGLTLNGCQCWEGALTPLGSCT